MVKKKKKKKSALGLALSPSLVVVADVEASADVSFDVISQGSQETGLPAILRLRKVMSLLK